MLVLTCCKGDCPSQWETPIFGPPHTGNPLTDLDKICHQWLRRRRDPHTKFGDYRFSGGVSPYRWSCQPQCLLFFSFWPSCSPA